MDSVHPEIFARNFRENFIFANNVKRHSCGAKNSRQVHDLPIPVIDRMISQFERIFFHETSHMPSFAKIKPSRKCPNLQYVNTGVY